MNIMPPPFTLDRAAISSAETAHILLEMQDLLGSVLQLGDRRHALDRDSALMGAIPELDSMAVLSVLTAIEEHFGFYIENDEVDAATFETVGALLRFVETKLGHAPAA